MTLNRRNLYRAAESIFQEKEEAFPRIPAVLGVTDDGPVEVQGRDSFVYCRLSDVECAPVYNQRVPLVAGLKVWVGYSKERPDIFQVLDIRDNSSFDPIQSNPPHADTHTFPERDTVWIKGEQFLPGIISPYSGTVVSVYPLASWDQQRWSMPQIQYLNLGSFMPSSGAVWALVEYGASGTTVVRTGGWVGNKLNLTPDRIPAPSGTALGAVALYGQGTIVKSKYTSDIVDLRTNSPRSGGGGLSDAPSDGKLYGRKNAVWAEATGSGASGLAGGDLSGTYPNPIVMDDSHFHHTGTLILPSWMPYGLEAGGDLTGTYPSPQIMLAGKIHAATNKILPVDNDEFGGTDSSSSYGLVHFLWSNVKAAIKISVETNTNDIFRVDNPGGSSVWVGTISGTPSGANVTVSAPTSGQEAVLVPASTSQLAKIRLYNLTRGNYASILNYNTTTNVVTLTANAPANWANGDSLTIASQTVTGSGQPIIDLEITSGPTGKSSIQMGMIITGGAAGDRLTLHPFETFAASKYKNVFCQVAGVLNEGARPIKITTDVFSMFWTGTPSVVILREDWSLL